MCTHCCHSQLGCRAPDNCVCITSKLQWTFFEDADQIVEGGDDKAKAEEGMSSEPGEEKGAEGEEEAEEK